MVKNAKDCIEETGPNNRTVSKSLLSTHLTPEYMKEGLRRPLAEFLWNPMCAEMLAADIERTADEEFIKVFGVTKKEAREDLKEWDLCWMPFWSSKQLVEVMTSGTCRDKEIALDSVELAQEVKELPEIFKPREGVRWAQNRGYPIRRSICNYVDIAEAWYGHPLSILSATEREESIRGKTDDDFDGDGTGLDKKKQLLWSDLFTRPPKSYSLLFEEIKENVTVYIREKGSLPTRAELWEYLKNKYEYNHKHKEIKLKEKTDLWSYESFNKRFSDWTKTG